MKHREQQEREKSRVNKNSHVLAYKKFERELEKVVNFVDADQTGTIDF